MARRFFGSVKSSSKRTPALPREGRAICGQQRRAEQRVRVLEQIVTDGGMQTAAQIEALRDAHGSPAERNEMNPFEMVVLIVAIVMVASVEGRYGYHSRRKRGIATAPAERVETLRLRTRSSS